MNREAEFENASNLLEELTVLSRLEARGTLRIALKAAGFDPKDLAREPMLVVVTKILPNELANRGIEDAESTCAELARRISESDGDTAPTSPEDVFARRIGIIRPIF